MIKQMPNKHILHNDSVLQYYCLYCQCHVTIDYNKAIFKLKVICVKFYYTYAIIAYYFMLLLLLIDYRS